MTVINPDPKGNTQYHFDPFPEGYNAESTFASNQWELFKNSPGYRRPPQLGSLDLSDVESALDKIEMRQEHRDAKDAWIEEFGIDAWKMYVAANNEDAYQNRADNASHNRLYRNAIGAGMAGLAVGAVGAAIGGGGGAAAGGEAAGGLGGPITTTATPITTEAVTGAVGPSIAEGLGAPIVTSATPLTTEAVTGAVGPSVAEGLGAPITTTATPITNEAITGPVGPPLSAATPTSVLPPLETTATPITNEAVTGAVGPPAPPSLSRAATDPIVHPDQPNIDPPPTPDTSGVPDTSGGSGVPDWVEPVVGTGAALLGGRLSDKAAQKAIEASERSTDKALGYLAESRDLAFEKAEPFRRSSISAIGGMMDMTGLEKPGVDIGGGELLSDLPQYDWQTDPGYQFRLSERRGALEKSAAARGGLNSGGMARELTRFNSDYASQEYGNIFNRLSVLGGYGPGAANSASSAAIATGGYGANAIMGGADTVASGYVAQGNAIQNSLQQIGKLPWENLGSLFGD